MRSAFHLGLLFISPVIRNSNCDLIRDPVKMLSTERIRICNLVSEAAPA